MISEIVPFVVNQILKIVYSSYNWKKAAQENLIGWIASETEGVKRSYSFQEKY